MVGDIFRITGEECGLNVPVIEISSLNNNNNVTRLSAISFENVTCTITTTIPESFIVDIYYIKVHSLNTYFRNY